MGRELGRISGPLLASNLLRNGVDLAFETDLLYLDVINGRIGIDNDAPTRELTVSGTTSTTNLLVDTQLDIPNFTINTNRIQNISGPIYITPDQLSDPTIQGGGFGTLNLRVWPELIKNITPDSDINLTPTGSQVVFNTNRVNVNGNLHATGNISWSGGSIVIGTNDNDKIIFEADVASSLTPDVTNTYDLGSLDKQWRTVYSHNLVANNVELSTLFVDGIDMLLTQGNTIYVSVNGSDTNTGEHLHSPFLTIQKALSIAQAGDEVVIYPGNYQEQFPLTVPQGVSIKGAGIRAVTIIPTALTNTNDAFLLNGETTVENLTVKDFYYDSLANTGYAFRFAPGMTVTARSPYVRNCTVITQETEAGNDAGRGALVDGSVASASSREAAMLFFSDTFIVPNADGITATNGARVEWLNSFTYFAYRGIHLTEGTLGFASLGVKFGAEMRSINSANVYGTYGAVADGVHTLAYLIGHNFGYVGTGTNSFNDRGLVVQANEVVELNSGTIYYDSMDHKGDYRVGNIFYVNQETGKVVFDAQSIDFGSLGNITLESPTSTTIINKDYVQTGNIRIYDNNVDSLLGSVNLLANSGTTYFNTNVNVNGLVDITGTSVFNGNIFFGDSSSDAIDVVSYLTQNINPGVTNTYTLGTDVGPYRWNTLFATGVNVDGVVGITNNTISTLTTDTDLEIVAAGTGKVKVTGTDVQVDQNLITNSTFSVLGETSLQDISLQGSILLTGDLNQTGDSYITGTFANNNIEITGNSYFEVNSIRLYDNVISAQTLDSDLVVTGAGSAGVKFDSALTIINSTITNTWSTASTDEQKSIKLTPNGTGDVVINTTKSLILPLGNNTTRTLSQLGEIRYNTSTTLFEGYQPSGLVSFYGLYDSDRNTYITAEQAPGANDNTIRFGVNGLVKATITSTALTTNSIHVDNVSILGNTLSNLVNSNDLTISTTGTGQTNINNIFLDNSNISNTLNSAITLASSGIGYVKFSGTGAVVMAIGTSLERRVTPEIGEIRNNTTIGYMEVYSGDPDLGDNGWIPAIGTSGAATEAQVNDIMDVWTLILG
jgi:hypothetical protein